MTLTLQFTQPWLGVLRRFGYLTTCLVLLHVWPLPQRFQLLSLQCIGENEENECVFLQQSINAPQDQVLLPFIQVSKIQRSSRNQELSFISYLI